MSANKPTGQIGPVKVQRTTVAVTSSWDKVHFPAEKTEIEKAIVEYFVRTMSKHGATILAAQANDEANHDFTLQLPGGRTYLELTELQYRDGPGRPYDSRSQRISTFTYAEQIAGAVQRKAERYGRAGSVPIHLLLYITHWRFLPNEIAIRLAQHLLLTRPPLFENVFLLWPTDEKDATVRVLFPADNPLEGHAADEFREHTYLNLDPAGWRVVPGTSVAEGPPPSPASA
ncbi:MAG: hypothetical protein JO292_11345 [Betaproteobacteria bacterium]|nr:hypothetical protein [Betaproteobacteria bacterium]